MITALIVDDEPLARRRIRRLLRDHTDVEVIQECNDGQSALFAIKECLPSLIFLDIHLPEMDGMRVLGGLGAHGMPSVVLTTAFPQYAIDAFDANVVDYLLKPFSQERFRRALDRVRMAVSGEAKRLAFDRTHGTEVRAQPRYDYPERISIPVQGRILLVNASEIDWIEADGNLVRVHTATAVHEVRSTLGALGGRLNPDQFLRIHRSTIVNVRSVREIHPWFNGHHLIILHNRKELRMSRYQSESIQRLLGS